MLLNCPECRNKISSEAVACPHCGRLTGKLPFPLPDSPTPRKLALPPDTKILRSDPDARAKWEQIRLKIRQAEAQQSLSQSILLAVAQAEEKQAELLANLRDRAWETFSAAGCPKCRAHAVQPLSPSKRLHFFTRGRLLAALFKKNYCTSCRHAW